MKSKEAASFSHQYGDLHFLDKRRPHLGGVADGALVVQLHGSSGDGGGYALHGVRQGIALLQPGGDGVGGRLHRVQVARGVAFPADALHSVTAASSARSPMCMGMQACQQAACFLGQHHASLRLHLSGGPGAPR